MSLADTWVQATAGTSDYFVEGPDCDESWWRNGVIGQEVGSMPQGASDHGIAFVGAVKEDRSDGRNYHEYVGACLTSPLQAGTEYTFTLLDIAAAAEDDLPYGGDTSGSSTEMICIPSCDEFQISGSDYKGDDYEILATAAPTGGLLIGGGEWKSMKFVTTPTQNCPAIMIGPDIDMTVQAGQTAAYVLYDISNLQEGAPGVCNADGECVADS